MPKLNGIEVVRQIKSQNLKVRALMLTAYDDEEYVLALVEAGAAGYILKTAHANELVDSVRSVYAGESVLDPAIVVKIAHLWAQKRTLSQRRLVDQLSPREYEVLQLAAEGLRNRAIAGKLGISLRTVEGHFGSIIGRLGVSSRMEAVVTALSRRIVTSRQIISSSSSR
jgi:DNA-binding NarL/FixJ family response regulator